MNLEVLDENEIHVWYTFYEKINNPSLLDAYHKLMNEEEAMNQQSFVFERGRLEYLVARALIRTTLSRYADQEPSKWKFRTNSYGRPEIFYPIIIPKLCFNLSHCEGLVACAVTLDREIGIDVENTNRVGSYLDSAESFFSPSEAKTLKSLVPEEQTQRFFEYWTLKEAYIKARGMGLSIPLDQFSFHLERGQPIRITFDSRLKDDPSIWQFELRRVSEQHQMAVGIRVTEGIELKKKFREVVPFERFESRIIRKG